MTWHTTLNNVCLNRKCDHNCCYNFVYRKELQYKRNCGAVWVGQHNMKIWFYQIICSDERLTFKTSGFQIFNGGKLFDLYQLVLKKLERN